MKIIGTYKAIIVAVSLAIVFLLLSYEGLNKAKLSIVPSNSTEPDNNIDSAISSTEESSEEAEDEGILSFIPDPQHVRPLPNYIKNTVKTVNTTTKQGKLPTKKQAKFILDCFKKWNSEVLSKNSTNFLIHQPEGGYGNQMIGTVSTLLLSLLTERAFFVYNPVLVNVVDWPFEWNWLLYKKQIPQTSNVGFRMECFFNNRGGSDSYYWTRYASENIESIHPPGQMIHTYCPTYHWIVKNPKYQAKILELGLVPKDARLDEYSFFCGILSYSYFFWPFTANVSEYHTEISEGLEEGT